MAKKDTFEVKTTAHKIPALVYVGPNLGAPLFLKRYQTFSNGVLPPQIRTACGENPHLATLFVSSHGLAKARGDLQRPTSKLAKAAAAMSRAGEKKEG